MRKNYRKSLTAKRLQNLAFRLETTVPQEAHRTSCKASNRISQVRLFHSLLSTSHSQSHPGISISRERCFMQRSLLCIHVYKTLRDTSVDGSKTSSDYRCTNRRNLISRFSSSANTRNLDRLLEVFSDRSERQLLRSCHTFGLLLEATAPEGQIASHVVPSHGSSNQTPHGSRCSCGNTIHPLLA